MLKEAATVNYAIEIIRILEGGTDHMTATEISEKLGGSQSYISKVLSRMSSIGILVSTNGGYALDKPATNITVAEVLSVCKEQDCGKGATAIINKLLDLAQSVPVSDIL